MKVFSNFTEAYQYLLSDVYNNPDFEPSPRGQKIKEKIGVTFRITNPRNRLPYVKGRDFNVSYFVAESIWYLSGNDSTEWIANYSSFWRNISDDGKTANSAYGSRIFKPHNRISRGVEPVKSQWDYVIDELCQDNDSRRAVVHIRSPQDSFLAKKDVPCTLTLQFFLRDDKVHLVTSMRSSDLILGIAYDVPAFTLFQELLANQLTQRLGRQIGLGSYTQTSNSLHVYEKHFGMVESIISEKTNYNVPEMPPLPLGELPIDGLMKFEDICRISSSQGELFDALWTSDKIIGTSHPYWDDWATIIAAHRAGKLGILEPEIFAQKKLMSTAKFEGYRFFNK